MSEEVQEWSGGEAARVEPGSGSGGGGDGGRRPGTEDDKPTHLVIALEALFVLLFVHASTRLHMSLTASQGKEDWGIYVGLFVAIEVAALVALAAMAFR